MSQFILTVYTYIYIIFIRIGINMSKKLTLSIDEKNIEFAHKYAKSTHQSISSLFEKFIEDLRIKAIDTDLPSKTKSLYGSLSNISVPDKKHIRKLFHEKSSN